MVLSTKSGDFIVEPSMNVEESFLLIFLVVPTVIIRKGRCLGHRIRSKYLLYISGALSFLQMVP